MEDLYEELKERSDFLKGLDQNYKTAARRKEIDLIMVRVKQLMLPTIKDNSASKDIEVERSRAKILVFYIVGMSAGSAITYLLLQ